MAVSATPESLEAAREAGLRYVSDEMPGIRRKRAGKGFTYTDPSGRPVRERQTLRRIKAMAVPPAWTDVWISPIANGHIQATGRDARGRKQYRYHPRWRAVRDANKYGRMVDFARALPRIRARVEADLDRSGLPRERVLATIVRLLEATFMRVGNEEYARENRSYGLTTLRDQHAEISGSHVRFVFRGKAGKRQEVGIEDRRVARIVKRCQDLPGQMLFKYVDDSGDLAQVDSGDVNDYLREASGDEFTAKDFRTWAGTVLAARALQELEAFDSQAQAKKNVVRAIEEVAGILGNTTSVCRKCYVHPAVIDAYLDGSMLENLRRRAEDELREGVKALRPEEAAVLALLQQRLRREADDQKKGAA
jgi:DNA topoisomerase-1